MVLSDNDEAWAQNKQILVILITSDMHKIVLRLPRGGVSVC